LPHVDLHAIAIDEQRQPFEPSLWRRSKFKHFNTAVEQVWFPGAHADIGEDKTAAGIIIPDSAKEKASGTKTFTVETSQWRCISGIEWHCHQEPRRLWH
jgi:hypothetical protein